MSRATRRVGRSLPRLRTVATAVLATARSTQLSFLAAALAYYLLVSLFPLALLAFVVASVVGGEAFAADVVASTEGVLSPAAAAVLGDAVRSATGLGGATVVGVVLLVWSGLRVFRGLDVAFSIVYGASPESLGERLRDAVVGFVAIGMAVVAVVALATVLAVAGVPLVGVFGPLALVVALSVTFLPIYALFPDAEVDVREALPGTVVAAVGWTVLGATFALYTTVADGFAAYGVVGGALLLLAWCYAASLILLAGATVNAALVGREDRHYQGTTTPRWAVMAADDPAVDADGEADDEAAREVDRLRGEVEELRAELDAKTMPRDELEADLRRYVRTRLRRGHARGWGPYLVLAYGTAMTLGAFYFLSGGWAILAMIVVWLSTLGLYTLMVLFGATVGLLGLPGRLRDAVGRFRS